MNSISSVFNKVVDTAYGSAICYDMLGYYDECNGSKLYELCTLLEKEYPFANFDYDWINYACEFKIIVEVKSNKKLTPKRIDRICGTLSEMKLSSFNETKAVFVFDDEAYFENKFINTTTHKVTGKKLVEKYGLKVVE